MTGSRIKTIVCGSTFGQFYLNALTALPGQFELSGILAKGSDRSKECAAHYGIDLYTKIEQLPDTIELACVILRSGSQGGKGTDLVRHLLERGIHVIQEQPVHYKELAACLKAARQNGLHFQVSNLYVQLPAVRRFIACARAMLEKQEALYIDAACSIQVSYPMIRIFSEALPAIRPWKIGNVMKGNGPFQTITGTLGNIPVTLRVHNEIDPRDPDNHLHLLHQLTIGVEGGRLSLVDTHGPVVWHPRLHVAYSHNLFNDLLTDAPAHLAEANTLTLGPADTSDYMTIFMKQWPAAIGRELTAIRGMIQGGDPKGAVSQKELSCAELWHDLTGAMGYATLRTNCRHQPLSSDILRKAASKIIEDGPKEDSGRIFSQEIDKTDIFDCTEEAENEIRHIDPEWVETFVERMDEAVLSSMLFALQSLGTLKEQTKEYSREKILDTSKTAPRHRHLILRWLQELAKQGYIEQRETYYRPNGLMTPETMDRRWKRVKEVWDNRLGDPSGLNYLMSNVEHLPQLITDDQQAALILFPEGRMEDFAKPLYGDTVYARYLNRSTAEAVVRIAAKKESPLNNPEKAALTILEVGAGTGSTTRVVAPRLKASVSDRLKLDYLYTDISQFFLSPARKRFEAFPWMRFQILDMEKDFQGQGLKPQSVDIVIAAGVLNNADNIDKVIQSFMEILVPGGWMLILEPAREFLEILISQAFMMTPPGDDRKETQTTFMSLKQWEDVFHRVRPKKMAALPEADHLLAPFGQKLFIVQKNK
ncbi:MAG: bifunctional Gfo/Idh/MocA family oxidoreductase/class I SAM-dependent methyltransferase [Desulfobacterales bacterium]|nr:bifunctional Gfo/Idh/MocA family oxidoreductase/class I SAM-dependent methyltransferase [Desulfobacterales bacterium]